MLVEVRKKQKTHGRELVLQCDYCSTQFIKKYKIREAERKHHFCNKECAGKAMEKGNKFYIDRQQALLETHGVTNISQLPQVKKKVKQTNLERYGNECGFFSKDVDGVEKRTKTCLERYGAENPFASKEIQEKITVSMVEKYGGRGFANKKAAKKGRETLQKMYGADHPMRIKEIRAKFDFEAWAIMIAKTKKKQVGLSSKIEDRFYELLCTLFDKEDIERQAQVKAWLIDFYIKSLDTYIQFDGVYWHGLDRPIEQVIEESRASKHKRSIFVRYLIDEKQNEWFKNENKTLIRITDLEFKKNNNIILERLFGDDFTPRKAVAVNIDKEIVEDIRGK